jgi:hypothetical protein|uniref:Peptidase S54 rhomboid domain-containing protein n=2 Tax=Attheya septentrionalis TaxID=420275 RepID=A0A7S2UKK0_9STRA|mmetsp:Transcript_27493/g.49907  ORF Transcript_27493/g.49907 Transcript_27493/m.49907 type:complete len:116 (+) Transcript_27493:222-569(+)
MIIMNVVVGSISPMIDNWGHIGGALGGAAMAYVFGPRIMVAQLPSGQRIMVDKPIARLPRPIEAIPETIGNGINRLTKGLHIPSVGLGHGSRKRQQYRERRRSSLPIRSIRPSAY